MIRSAQAEDVDAVSQLVQDAYRPYIARLGKPPGPMLDDYALLIAEQHVWVLENEGALTAVLVLKDAGPGALLLDNIAVSPTAQGKGYGRKLVAFAEAEASRRGNTKIRLYTHVLMTENLALYHRLGFRETGRVSERGYERVYMEKQLI